MSKAFPTVHKLAAQALVCLAAASMLAGCATKGGTSVASTAGNGADIITASDETNARKRAKLRLELAVGYFQQGQTTVALDEVKQSLTSDPTFADAYNLRGLIYMRLNDAGLAEDSFRRAIALTPREPNTLHNYGWLLCQEGRYGDSAEQFSAALAVPNYTDRAKTLMAQGVCQLRAGQRAEAEKSLLQAYELDTGNPVIGFNLASLLAQREDWSRAQFYIRRVNNSPAANAESLWLGIKVERRLNNREALAQLANQLQRRFPQSREAIAYERGNFNE
ncbi:MAG: type IV pilus biogenesis/stability protein PilW [Gammaproteobacteria bacterium]|nr:type IV pilus biogenesis/stability protein PilW [Gammaproteobacteria bacterium]MBU1441394.1 type IV pilus biogenesis/stability protein PilW [Gammaproteobacteria bacterium]MBU2285972.1 type IV pilus biogenesis/stability protein PilW [Gammaproteobacteria bacterium]MBU2407133.1 type IV pilus biogenesis/stability protein PilW [Gammaproteobacteria bacterium]